MLRRIVLLALLLPTVPGHAHQNSRAVVEVRVVGTVVRIRVRATPYDLAPLLQTERGVRPLPELYRARRDEVLRGAAAYLTVALVDGPLCRPGGKTLRRAEPTNIELELEFRCPRLPDELELRYDLLFDDDPLHRAFVVAPDEPGQPRALLDADRRSFRLHQQVSVWQHARSYLRLGVEHIFTGHDHLCFLLGLLLCAAARRPQPGERPVPFARQLLAPLAIVTAFTVAHSLTLAGAALDLLRLPARLVEPAIALSIVYVGVENLVRPEPRRRWLLAFGFGLVHGFGFAHLLREVGLPHRGLLLSLLAFNAGVELGQLTLVSALFPVLLLLGRERPGVREGSLAAVLLAGLLLVLAWSGGVPLGRSLLLAPAALAAAVLAARQWGYRRAVLRGGSLLIASLGVLWTVQRLLGG